MDMPGFVLEAGQGEPSRSGDRVTIEFIIQDDAGKEIANSERRGLPQTFNLFSSNADAILNSATLGAKKGESRAVVMLAEEWYADISALSLIRNPGPLLIRVRVLDIERR